MRDAKTKKGLALKVSNEASGLTQPYSILFYSDPASYLQMKPVNSSF